MNKITAPTPEQLKKQEALKQYFEKLGSVAVAFSSGVDSTYLLKVAHDVLGCLLYTSPSPRDAHESRMPSSA